MDNIVRRLLALSALLALLLCACTGTADQASGSSGIYGKEAAAEDLSASKPAEEAAPPDSEIQQLPEETQADTADPAPEAEGTGSEAEAAEPAVEAPAESSAVFDLSEVPEYSGAAWTQVNGNVPYFTQEELAAAGTSYESYGDLDALGRCTACMASVGQDLMPTEERGEIGMVKPTGWQTIRYDIVDGKYLYNRCHLIGYQLTGENANVQNLITGTRSLNIEGMLDFEDLIAEYVEDSGMHVLYRVTPVFVGQELLARGVLMEGMSVEDAGESVRFCVFAYNTQPGIVIDYRDGCSRLAEDGETQLCISFAPDTTGTSAAASADAAAPAEERETAETQTPEAASGEEATEADSQTDTEEAPEGTVQEYVLNTNSMRFHTPDCSSVDDIKEKNREDYTGTREALISMGYAPCGRCNP